MRFALLFAMAQTMSIFFCVLAAWGLTYVISWNRVILILHDFKDLISEVSRKDVALLEKIVGDGSEAISLAGDLCLNHTQVSPPLSGPHNPTGVG